MTRIKVDEVEISDLIRIEHKGALLPVSVSDIQYRPRALILSVTTEDELQSFEVSFPYGTPVEMIKAAL